MNPQFEQARAQFAAGVQAFEAGRLDEAEALFLRSLQILPGRPSTLANLAAVRQALGRPAEALAALDEAVKHAPDDVAAWYHRGQVLQQLQRPADALTSYDRLLALQPGHAAAWSQRGGILKDMGRREEAAHCFRQALAHGGDAELNGYFLASVQPELAAPKAAPAAYVQALFDSYADEFDEHLVGKLGYRTPWLLAELLAAQAPGRRFAGALDLGCGTGLMGPLLAPHCQWVDGLDLSAQMLAKAQALGCYRQLHHAEVVQHLAHSHERHDLLVAADVFVYIGDLQPVFASALRVLEPGGLMLFSVEEAAPGTAQFELRASSRYAHAEGYVRTLAQEHGLQLQALQRTPLRHEQRRPIGGLLVLLSRPPGG